MVTRSLTDRRINCTRIGTGWHWQPTRLRTTNDRSEGTNWLRGRWRPTQLALFLRTPTTIYQSIIFGKDRCQIPEEVRQKSGNSGNGSWSQFPITQTVHNSVPSLCLRIRRFLVAIYAICVQRIWLREYNIYIYILLNWSTLWSGFVVRYIHRNYFVCGNRA